MNETLPAPAPTILLIDDDEAGVAIRKRVLEGAGYTVLCALTGRAGLEVVDLQRVHLVVLDFHLPDMNGDAVLAGIRSRKPELPVILFSGTFGMEGAAATPDAILVKGEGPVVLLRTIADLVARARPTPA